MGERPEPTFSEMIALAHAVDPALRMLDVQALKPVQGEAMHKVIGYHAYNALRQVGWLNPQGSLVPMHDWSAEIPEDWRKVYVVEEPNA